MEYKIYRQFPKKFWHEFQTHEDLSDYLSEHKIINIVGAGSIKGQLDGLDIKVAFCPTFNGSMRKAKTVMRGRITISDSSYDSQRKVTEVLTLLAQYMPSYLRE